MLMTFQRALIGHDNGQLQLIDPYTTHTIRQMNGHTDGIPCIVYCPKLSRVITGSKDGTALVWNLMRGECVHVLDGHAGHVLCASVHDTSY